MCVRVLQRNSSKGYLYIQIQIYIQTDIKYYIIYYILCVCIYFLTFLQIRTNTGLTRLKLKCQQGCIHVWRLQRSNLLAFSRFWRLLAFLAHGLLPPSSKSRMFVVPSPSPIVGSFSHSDLSWEMFSPFKDWALDWAHLDNPE